MKRVVLAGAVALLSVGVSAQQKGADEAAIAKVRAAYQTAANSQNGAAMAKLFTPDGVQMPPNAPSAKGPAAIEAFSKGFAKQWMQHGITITSTATRVTGDTAYDVGTYKQQLMSQSTGGVFDDTGKYVVLLKKGAGGTWLITHAIYNSDLAPPAPKK